MECCSTIGYDDLHKQTDTITEEMKNRLGDVICVGSWTELDLTSELEMGEQERRKVMNVIWGKSRKKYWSRRSKNDK